MNRKLAGISSHLHIVQERLTRVESKLSSKHGAHPKQINRQNTSMRQKHDDDQNDDVPSLSSSEGVHRLCLQEKIQKLVNDIDLKTTPLMDELIEDGCVTQDEASVITDNFDRKNQIRRLVYLISRRSRAKFIKFIEKLQRSHNYPYLAKELSESFQNKLTTDHPVAECLVCVIKQDVDIEHVAEKLCQFSIIDLEFLNMIATRDRSILHDQNNLWEAVFEKINQSRDRRQLIRKLQEALSVKYEHIAAKLNLYIAKQLACYCGDNEQNKTMAALMNGPFPMSFAGSFGSISDLSTTSETQRFFASKIAELQSPTVSNISMEIGQRDLNHPGRTNPLPHTLQWLESIDSAGYSLSSQSDSESNILSASMNKRSFEQFDETLVEEENNNQVDSTGLTHTGDQDNNNFFGPEPPSPEDLRSNTSDVPLRSGLRKVRFTTTQDVPKRTYNTEDTTSSQKFEFYQFDHQYSATRKFSDANADDFLFSVPDKLEEPVVKRKKKLRKRTSSKPERNFVLDFLQRRRSSDKTNKNEIESNAMAQITSEKDTGNDQAIGLKRHEPDLSELSKDVSAISLNGGKQSLTDSKNNFEPKSPD